MINSWFGNDFFAKTYLTFVGKMIFKREEGGGGNYFTGKYTPLEISPRFKAKSDLNTQYACFSCVYSDSLKIGRFCCKYYTQNPDG